MIQKLILFLFSIIYCSNTFPAHQIQPSHIFPNLIHNKLDRTIFTEYQLMMLQKYRCSPDIDDTKITFSRVINEALRTTHESYVAKRKFLEVVKSTIVENSQNNSLIQESLLNEKPLQIEDILTIEEPLLNLNQVNKNNNDNRSISLQHNATPLLVPCVIC